MQFVRFAHAGSAPSIGVVDADLIRIIPGHDDLLPLIQRGADALAEAGAAALAGGEAVPLAGTPTLSPIATPPTFRDFYAFEAHVLAGRRWRGLEMDPLWYEIPVFYYSSPYAIRGAGDVPMNPGTESFDFELEVAAIIGTGGHDLSAEEGEAAIIGYAVLNDFSARDLQQSEMRLSLGAVKGKDTATALGPYLVTKDELEPYRTPTGFDRTMTLTVNGVEYSRANWSEVHYSFGEMISYASRGTEVRPGDVIASGTCGTGCLLELRNTRDPEQYPWLQPGDEVVATVEGLGSLRSRVVASPPPRSFRRA